MVDIDELLAKLKSIRRELRAEYLQPHDSPWIVGFSGGKDSRAPLETSPYQASLSLDAKSGKAEP